jgi:hypothetical protein
MDQIKISLSSLDEDSKRKAVEELLSREDITFTVDEEGTPF